MYIYIYFFFLYSFFLYSLFIYSYIFSCVYFELADLLTLELSTYALIEKVTSNAAISLQTQRNRAMRLGFSVFKMFFTWSRAHEATREISTWKLLLQNGDNLLIKILHGHWGDVPQLLQNLMSSLGSSGGVHIAQHTVNFINHLTKYTEEHIANRLEKQKG